MRLRLFKGDLILSINKTQVEEATDKQISIGQLYQYDGTPHIVIKIVIPTFDSFTEGNFDKEYFALASLKTGWVDYLSESLKELDHYLFDQGYKQVKSKVTIVPGE